MTLPASWLFIAPTCSVVLDIDVSFVRSAAIPGEATKTCLDIGHTAGAGTPTLHPKAEDTPSLVQHAVGNAIPKRIWDDTGNGFCR